MRQYKQKRDEAKKRRLRYLRNKSDQKRKALRRYKTRGRLNVKMRERRKNYRENPKKFRRGPPRPYKREEKKAAALWYHGSPKRFEGMETSVRHTFGRTPSEVPLFFSPSKSFAKGYAPGPDGTIYTARLKWRKVFDGGDLYTNTPYWPPEYDDLTPDGKELYEDLAAGRIFSGVGEDDWSVFGDSQGLFANILNNHYDVIETTEFKKWLKKNSYDAAYVTGDGEINVFVFSPQQVEIVGVESARGTRAASAAERVATRYREAEGIIFYYNIDDNPANSEIKQPGKDVNYRAVSPTTYELMPDDRDGVGPAQAPPSDQSEDVPPASSRVIPDAMKNTLEDQLAQVRLAAATIPQILGNCGPLVTSRAKKVQYRRLRLSKSGLSRWEATGSSGEKYIIRLKPIKKGNTKYIWKLPVKVSCSCPFFRWQGPEHWAKTNDYLWGRPRGTASFPVIRDPIGEHWACKHVIAVLELAKKQQKQWRIASTSQWSYDGPLAPLPDPGRVAARYAARHLMWHGTAGKNLRGILKQGLLPSGTPKVFGEEITDHGGLSIKTHGGVYLTDNWMTAYSAAGTSGRAAIGVKSGPVKSRVMVGVTIDDRSPEVLADEDDVLKIAERLVGRAYHDLRSSNHVFAPLLYGDWEHWKGGWKPQHLEDVARAISKGDLSAGVGRFMEQVFSYWPKAAAGYKARKPQVDKAVGNLLRAFAAHMVEQGLSKTTSAIEEALEKNIEGVPKYYDDPKDIEERITLYRDHQRLLRNPPAMFKNTFGGLKKATQVVSSLIPEMASASKPNWSRHNLRFMQPITYRGKNRILMVAEIQEPTEKGMWKYATIVFHYGTQKWREFIKPYSQRIGPTYRVVDGEGKLISWSLASGDEWPEALWGPPPRAVA